MAKKAKKKNKRKGTVLTIILTALITTIGMYVYNTYTKIDVNPQNYETQKTLSTEKEQTVENVEQKSQTIANTLEQTMERNIKTKRRRKFNIFHKHRNNTRTRNRNNHIRKRIYTK